MISSFIYTNTFTSLPVCILKEGKSYIILFFRMEAAWKISLFESSVGFLSTSNTTYQAWCFFENDTSFEFTRANRSLLKFCPS